MSRARAAVVLGASGSVGHALVAQLICSGLFDCIVTLVRRSQPTQRLQAEDAGVALRETLIEMMHAAALQTATHKACELIASEIVGFSVLGIGAGTAKLSIDAHRAIDVELNAAFARGLRASGRVQHLLLMSAVGADPAAATTGSGAPGLARYARVKGEVEQAVKNSGLAVVSIFRPAMIIGSQHTPWLLETLLPALSFLTPAKYRSISVEQIARAMVATAVSTSLTSDIYHYTEMRALSRRFNR